MTAAWLHGLLAIVFAICAVRIAAADIRWRLVPDVDLAVLLTVGLASNLLGTSEPLADVFGAASRATIVGAAAGLSAFTFERVRGYPGLGLGDVKLIGVGGAWMSYGAVLHAVTLAAVAALAALLALALWRRLAPEPSMRVPFAAALAPALYLVWLSETLSC